MKAKYDTKYQALSLKKKDEAYFKLHYNYTISSLSNRVNSGLKRIAVA